MSDALPASLPTTQATPPAPGLLLRLAVMTYEAVLLFGVVFIVSYALLGVTQWTYPLTGYRRWVLQAVLFVAIGLYFVWCWSHSGQTLPLKTWRLRVVGRDGGRVTYGVAIARYLLAWHLFLPGIVAIALLQSGLRVDTPLSMPAAIAILSGSFIAMLLLAYTDPQRRLLHDRWLGTNVVRV
jgi:uncharacterized RDD family membrane protein YckC